MSELNIGVGSADISENALKYITDVLRTGRLSYGPYLKRFEREFAKLHGCEFGLTASSGTDALRTAIAALKEIHGWADGDEIIVPAITFIATSNVVLQNNLKPVFVDVDPLTYNIDPKKIEERITQRTRAIIPVHLFGLPCDMDPIMDLARKHDLRVVEDSCETMFVKYKGKSVGAFGDYSCFSTYVAHLLVTGVGGVILCNDRDLAITARSLLNHGRDSIYFSMDDDDNLDRKSLSTVMERRFSFVRMGYSSRLTELEGALGLSQLETKDAMLGKRKSNGEYLISHLSKYSDRIQLPTIPPDRGHAFMLFPIVVKDEKIHRNELTLFLEERGIETRFLMPLLNQPVYIKLFGNLEDGYPVAKWINKNGFYLGCHQHLGEKELDFIVASFDEFFSKN
ncbi:MAG TPA: DegT/DnrJ/EryC1/StrS aminotransferase family protein [Candidatus Norongarragalinales archaeon]|nr:DegT/DnrJ/EryC1/StrS aminotransferase family protein [Candidatus Norongarragalinales archaeon]